MKTLLSAGMLGSSSEPHPSASLLASSLLPGSSTVGSVDASVECPKCGKRSIVARSHNTFDCLNCNFHRELPPVANRTLTPGSSALSNSLLQRQALIGRSLAHGQRPLPQTRLGQNVLNANGRDHPTLFSTTEARRPPFGFEDELTDPPGSQPWIFALIAVIFGILLL
ncbi:MAG: hypothetical protein AAFV85_09505 [Cyanobacteria bacterium J06634_6]